MVQQYQALYFQLQDARKQLDQLQQQKNIFTREYDYNKFLFDELEEASFKENELEQSETELKLLSNSEGIKTVLSKMIHELSESDQPIVQELKSLQHQLASVSPFHPDVEEIVKRIQSTQIELQDIADELERINDHVNHDPKRIEQLNERISAGYHLLKKHGVKTTGELLSIRASLEEKLQAVLNIDDAISAKQKEVDLLLKSASESADILSEQRKKQVKPLQEKVNRLLVQVGMPNARLKVDILELGSLQAHGKDSIDFLFDANKSNRFEPIRKVASGGELSRLMLSIKSLVAQSIDLPTYDL